MTGAWRYTTINCVREWHWYARPGLAEAVRTTSYACVRASALAIPLALPGAAFLPPVPHGGVVFGGPALSGPAYEIGAVFAPGVYALPGVTGIPVTEQYQKLTPTVHITPMLSGDVPHWLPDREVPPTDVPEPSTWMVMVGALIGCLGLRRWVR